MQISFDTVVEFARHHLSHGQLQSLWQANTHD